VQGDLALLALGHCLQLLLLLDVAVPTVTPLGLAGGILLHADDPVVEAIVANRLRCQPIQTVAAYRRCPMNHQHLDDELTHKVEVGLLDALDPHPEPPGVD